MQATDLTFEDNLIEYAAFNSSLDDTKPLSTADRLHIQEILHILHDHESESPQAAHLYVALQQRLRSPIERIPDDVLLTLFIVLSKGFDVFDRDAIPWKVSVVCRRWRNVSASPLIWTDFTVTTKLPRWGAMALVYQKSAMCPLNVRLEMVPSILTGQPSGYELIPRVISELMADTSRWKTFHLRCRHRVDVRVPASLSYPILERLVINAPFITFYSPALRSSSPFNKTFLNAPSLRSLSIAGLDSPKPRDFNWETLTEYTCNKHDTEVLRLCVNLKTYIVQNEGRDDGTANGARPLVHRNITKLITNASQVLFDCALPALEDLSFFTTLNTTAITAYHTIMSSSRPQLRRLVMSFDDVHTWNVVQLQTMLANLAPNHPALEVLYVRLRCHSAIAALKPLFTSLSMDSSAAPRLRILRVSVRTDHIRPYKEDAWKHLLPALAAARKDTMRVLNIRFDPVSRADQYLFEQWNEEAENLVDPETVAQVREILDGSGFCIKIHYQCNGVHVGLI